MSRNDAATRAFRDRVARLLFDDADADNDADAFEKADIRDLLGMDRNDDGTDDEGDNDDDDA
jgi:hypothetical protein